MLAPLILKCRMDVCLAYVRSPLLAMEEVASASLKLAGHAADGALSTAAAYDPLQEVSENLGLVALFGQDAVQSQIAYGPLVYADAIAAGREGTAA